MRIMLLNDKDSRKKFLRVRRLINKNERGKHQYRSTMDNVKCSVLLTGQKSSFIRNHLTPYSAITKGYCQGAFQYVISKLWNSLHNYFIFISCNVV